MGTGLRLPDMGAITYLEGAEEALGKMGFERPCFMDQEHALELLA